MTRCENQALIHGRVAEKDEIEGNNRAHTATATARAWNVQGGPGIPEPRRLEHDGRAASRDWATPLELAHGQIDSVTEERSEGSLQTVLRHQALQVAVLAASQLQKLPVRAVGMLVDRALHQRQEIGLAPLEASPERRARFLGADGTPEKTRQSRQESYRHAEVGDPSANLVGN
jgi:hypothetical protein